MTEFTLCVYVAEHTVVSEVLDLLEMRFGAPFICRHLSSISVKIVLYSMLYYFGDLNPMK
jgi:hypothetical protein